MRSAENGPQDFQIDGDGSLEKTKEVDRMETTIDGFGTIEQNGNQMKITLRIGATKYYLSAAASAIGAAMTLY